MSVTRQSPECRPPKPGRWAILASAASGRSGVGFVHFPGPAGPCPFITKTAETTFRLRDDAGDAVDEIDHKSGILQSYNLYLIDLDDPFR